MHSLSLFKVLCYLQSEKNLSRCSTKFVHVCKKLPLALNCKQSKYYWQIYNAHISSILGVALVVPFLCYFQKFQFREVKTFWNNFRCIVLLFVWARKVCLRFLSSCFKLEIFIFLSLVGRYFCPLWVFLVDMFN